MTLPALNPLHTCRQIILSSDVTYFRIFATGNTNNATLHLSVRSLSFPLILHISLPSCSLPFSHRAVPPAFLLQHPFFCESRAKPRNTPSAFNMLLLSVPRFYACLREIQANWKAPRTFPVRRVETGLQRSLCAEAAPTSRSAEDGQNWFLLPTFLSRRLLLKKAAWQKTLKSSKQCNTAKSSVGRAESP